ncbi:hypothetical protein [Tenggerimyces flavus]|uniref:Uncharacterized protein n=1 Tax=Tenggerimyces flavus TaxID=1708749 RepID=A0ABV7YEU3_9ACTN|nr:hypothetical protein [Tenggerimyces flavus]MBM7788034.1 ABC-type nickel/cobalt efflux system permease component RcnA [Tenggerimyces flavus]
MNGDAKSRVHPSVLLAVGSVLLAAGVAALMVIVFVLRPADADNEVLMWAGTRLAAAALLGSGAWCAVRGWNRRKALSSTSS